VSHLEVSGLGVRYGAVRALHDVTLDVQEGACVALLGANGAGKTTLLRAVGGLLGYHGGCLASGTIRFEGRAIGRADASALVAAGIGQALEGRRIFGELTVAENLRVGAFAARSARSRQAVRDELLELFPILRARLDHRAGLLSGGQQQMLAIARAIMAQPRLLLLDEPSLGLAPIVVAQIADALRRINAGGTSILLADQNTALALRATDYAYLLESGRVRTHAPTKELVLDDTLRASYLGTSGGHEQVAQEVTA
jgi:ABC-type branched-subunit amino acid transport system ATPase component